MFYVLKKLDNHAINKSVKMVVNSQNDLIHIRDNDKDIYSNYDYTLNIQNNPDDLIHYIGMMGDLLTKYGLGENDFIKNYYPNLNSTFFELYMIYAYTAKLADNELRDNLNLERYNGISEVIWRIHSLDTIANQKYILNYKKANDSLHNEGYKKSIDSIDQLKQPNCYNDIKKVNTYIISLILLAISLKDNYAFGSIYEELHKTDEKELEKELEKLNIDYINNLSIIKGLKTNPESITKVLKRD